MCQQFYKICLQCMQPQQPMLKVRPCISCPILLSIKVQFYDTLKLFLKVLFIGIMAIILQCSTVSQFYIQIAFFKYMEVHNNFRIDYRTNTYYQAQWYCNFIYYKKSNCTNHLTCLFIAFIFRMRAFVNLEKIDVLRINSILKTFCGYLFLMIFTYNTYTEQFLLDLLKFWINFFIYFFPIA